MNDDYNYYLELLKLEKEHNKPEESRTILNNLMSAGALTIYRQAYTIEDAINAKI